MTTSLAQRIRDYDDFEFETVTVPEWGGVDIEIYRMDGASRSKYLRAASDDEGNVDWESIYPELIIATAHEPRENETDGPTNRPVFTPADREWLNTKSAKALERLAKTAMRMSGMTDSEDELGKSSSTTTNGSTAT